jgi:hypothetical protein
MKILDDFISYVVVMFLLGMTAIYGIDNMKKLGKILERHCE